MQKDILCIFVEAAKGEKYRSVLLAEKAVKNNVPLPVVKVLLERTSIQTTEIYLHISNRFRRDLKSPLDSLTF